jgi:chemotaxis protein MotB
MDESWLIPYADLLTLLLALFIVLFATSSLDQAKYNAIKEALYEAFNGELPQGGTGQGKIPDDILLPYPGAGLPGQIPSEEPDPSAEPSGVGDGGPLGNLYTSMTEYVHANELENTVAVEFNGENVLITLKNDLWFESGSAEVTSTMREKAAILAQILKENQNEENPFEIIVAGHTDNRPINTPRYPSNLDLSLDRAAEVHRFLLKASGLSPAYFSSRGYGEEQPIASNDTVEGRAKNRRVELLISQPMKQSQS